MTVIHLMLFYLFTIISSLMVLTAVGHIFYEKRSPSSMISWILAIVFMPFIAVPLYFVIGIRKREFLNKKTYVKIDQPQKYQQYHIDPARHNVLSLLAKNDMPAAMLGNKIQLILSPTEAFDALLQQIHQAQKYIDICTYVFKFDDTTKILMQALEKKAQQGVQVRLLIDAVGSWQAYLTQYHFKKFKKAGIKVVFFMPIFRKPFQSYINLRNHRKIYLFDQKILLSGGMNLTDEYMGPVAANDRWDDLLYQLEGPAVLYFYYIFSNDWAYAVEKQIDLTLDQTFEWAGDDVVQVVPSGPDIAADALYETLLNAIYNAKERIWMVTPYFVPCENIIQALIIAKHKGVDVRLITPKESNHRLADLGRSSYMRQLHQAEVAVMLYEGSMLHAKAILIDDVGMIGSVNLDNRSLFLNYEIVSFVYSGSVVQDLQQWMQGLMTQSTQGMTKPGRVRESFENIIKVFAPLL